MATTNQLLRNNNTTTQATSNVQANINQVQQPNQSLQTLSTAQQTTVQPTQVQNNQAQNAQTYNVPTPVAYQQQTNTNAAAYQNVMNNYQSQYSNYEYQYPTIKIPTADTNTIEGQYQSIYSSAINELANNILNMRFSYNPNEDDLLQQASQYVTQNTFESMNSKGILNSSMTAERVAQVVGNLIPEYEKMAREEFDASFTRLINTANLIMTMDDRAFSQWQDARDQKWKEEEAEYQKQQDAIENAWQRVDELGYVDNESSIVLGVPVGTLSKDAREAKEAYEREIEKWNRQHEIEKATEIELLNIKQQLEKDLYSYQLSEDDKSYANRAEIDNAYSKDLYKYQSDIDKANSISDYEEKLKLEQKYGTSSSSSSNNSTTSLSTYESIIENRWANEDIMSGKQTIPAENNEAVYNYLVNEYAAGRLNGQTLSSLVAKYGITAPTQTTSTNNTTSTQKVTPGLTSDNVETWRKALDGNNQALNTLGVTIFGQMKSNVNNNDAKNAVNEALRQIESGEYTFTTNQQLMNDLKNGKFGHLGWGL